MYSVADFISGAGAHAPQIGWSLVILPNVTPGKNPEGLTIPQIAGNRVIIDMGSGHYAMYAHLAPGSIQVKVGDHVQQGQKLGLLGNTGNSSAPHLHFQVMDRPSSLDDTSLPFVFDRMNLEGRVQLDLTVLDENTDKKIALPMDKKDAKPLTRVMPLSRDVVGFPQGPLSVEKAEIESVDLYTAEIAAN